MRILRSAGPALDKAVMDAVGQWEFTPTRLYGIPVAVVMTVTVAFSLNERRPEASNNRPLRGV